MKRWIVAMLAVALGGCGGGGGGGAAGRIPAKATPLVVAAGLSVLGPAADDSFALGLDLDRLGLAGLDAVYDVTTPAGEPFRFEILSTSPGSSGPVSVSVAHAEDDGAVPAGGSETLLDAGIIPSAPAATSRGPWLDSHGDGFARIALSGRIRQDQVLVVAAENAQGTESAVIRIRIGEVSPINLSEQTTGDYPGLLDTRTIYSSDSPMFGLPTAAVSGDRTSIVCYEGDRANRGNYVRYELRLQHDAALDAVTGGGSEETSPDSGNWRDHEIAALHNVLALVHSGTDRVTVKLSFDRGATFAQTEDFPVGGPNRSSRLVQVEMALDYSLAVVFWGPEAEDRSELVLVEGRPAEIDGDGSPTHYEFDRPAVLHRESGSVTPVPMGIAWSTAGDLVIAYGYSRFTSRPDGTWESLTRTHCAVRPYGGVFTDTIVDEDLTVGKDPSVAVAGGGADLTIFLAYEGPRGVRLAVSTDAGVSFAPVLVLDDGSTHTPAVLARERAGTVVVDLLFLAGGEEGTELDIIHWDDYGHAPPGRYRLTKAVSEWVESPPDSPWPDGIAFAPPGQVLRITQVAWFGYDAVVSGDEVVVVVDEETSEGWLFLMGAPMAEFGDALAGGAALPRDFTPAEPPPLAPGMTEIVAPPDPAHMHQLKLLRLR